MEEIVHEGHVPKKRGRHDGQSANGDVEMTHPPDEEDIAMESPLSDPPSSTNLDIEPPNMTEPLPTQNALSETEHISQALDEGNQQQSSLVHGVHPELSEAASPRTPVDKRQDDSSPTVSPDSSMFPTQRRESMEAVEIVSPRSPHRPTSFEDAQIDIHSVSLKVHSFRSILTFIATDIPLIVNNANRRSDCAQYRAGAHINV
jgi:hypothetical protein